MNSSNIARAAARSVTGAVLGAGASMIGVIVVTVYTAAIGVAVVRELRFFERPRRPR